MKAGISDTQLNFLFVNVQRTNLSGAKNFLNCKQLSEKRFWVYSNFDYKQLNIQTSGILNVS